MRSPVIVTLVSVFMGVGVVNGAAVGVQMPRPSDWVRYKVMRASEWTPAAADSVTITVGAPARLEEMDLVWWQMVAAKEDGGGFVVQALSERAPMTAENGDIGVVFRYVFRQQDHQALEYVNSRTGLAHLPMFGFREGLIPTPRSTMNRVGPFLGTGNYLGQALAAQENGAGGEWLDLEPVRKLALDDDVLIGTARTVKDDGTGQDKNREYRYIELTAQDYDQMIDAGFNIFGVNDKHVEYVRDRDVFFIKRAFSSADPYPEMLYRSNYWGPAMFSDEPAIRLNTSECSSVYDAANLLRLRNYAYHRMPGSVGQDHRLTQSNAIVSMIQQAGFSLGDWLPVQSHVGVWETIYESAFYQLQGGAASIVHEGRYRLDDYNGYLASVLGPGAKVDVKGMFDLTYCFMRGAARCFGGEWGTAIYGQADYSIAPEAIKQAYDMGAHYIWYWTSDHDHHLPWTKQLELSRIFRAYQKQHPRMSRVPQLRAASAAVAIPDGYMCGVGPSMWSNSRFRYDKLNEYGVPYGDINAEAYWQMYRLLMQRIDFDCVVDVPEVIDNAGYERIIRIGADGRTNLPAPRMPAAAVGVSVKRTGALEEYAPRPGAPKATAEHVRTGEISIDGKLDDWAGMQWIDLDEKLMYEVTNDKWGGKNDLSAQAAFAYDADSVYIAVRAQDDIMHLSERGDLIWQNDCVQVGFDPLFNPHPQGSNALDDVEIGFSLVDGKPYAHQWNRRPSGAPGAVSGAEVAITRDGNMTYYEARVPFSALWPLTPSFPGRCGMTVAVNDSDTNLRKGAVAWTRGLVESKNPSMFGVLEFAGSGSLKQAAPMAFAQAERTVVKRGENAVIRLDTGTREPGEAELVVTVRHNDLSAPPAAATFNIPAGMSRFDVGIETGELESDSYDVDMVIKSADRTAVEQSFRIYVLPGD